MPQWAVYLVGLAITGIVGGAGLKAYVEWRKFRLEAGSNAVAAAAAADQAETASEQAELELTQTLRKMAREAVEEVRSEMVEKDRRHQTELVEQEQRHMRQLGDLRRDFTEQMRRSEAIRTAERAAFLGRLQFLTTLLGQAGVDVPPWTGPYAQP